MKPDIAKQWVAALRSGEYVQARERLCKLSQDNIPTGFCCLGVLCELAVKAGIIHSAAYVDGHGDHARIYGPITSALLNESGCLAAGSLTVLPTAVMNWAGMIDNGGRLTGNTPVALTSLNDRGESFETIANLIEKRWEDL